MRPNVLRLQYCVNCKFAHTATMCMVGPWRVDEVGLRERKKERTRQTLADVAAELFDRQGFQDTTIKQIADAAEVSPRTVSAYFPVKEELVFCDHRDVFDQLEQRLDERPAGATTVGDAAGLADRDARGRRPGPRAVTPHP